MYNNFENIYAPVLTGRENLNRTEIQVKCCFHDDSTPSMNINTDNGCYHCKGCGANGSAVGFYMKTRGISSYTQALKDLNEFDENYKNKPSAQLPKKEVKPDTDYTNYWWNTYENSIQHPKNWAFYGQKLYELRGITYSTAVACGIGYDVNKGWILPIFRYKGDGKCVGYEVRHKLFEKFPKGNKCFRGDGSARCLSVVYQGWDNRKAIICEGFMDSIFMYQYLHEKNKGEQVEETIMTPSHGVAMLPDVIAELELWKDFDEVMFVLDNDPWEEDKDGVLRSPGNQASDKIAELPHGGVFKFFGGLPEGYDWEQFYKKEGK